MKYEKSIWDSFFDQKLKINAHCIITAAGESSRMGCWKGSLTVPAGSEGQGETTLIQKAVSTALESCQRVVVVGGRQMEHIRMLIPQDKNLQIIENPDYKEGMLSSIKRALPFVEGDFFILPMDMPLITPVHLYHLHRSFFLNKSHQIVRPVYRGQPGHPVLLPSVWNFRIRSMPGRSLKQNLTDDDQLLIPWKDESVVLDLDTQAAYREFLDHYRFC
ncbi:MAG: nucleotidyltransferase family protein [Spirochaetales bacterium]|nr:nucleotidyltransferase family protein [Spirochaetales bacterium]